MSKKESTLNFNNNAVVVPTVVIVPKDYETQINKIFSPINSSSSEINCYKIYEYLEGKKRIKSLVDSKDYKDIKALSPKPTKPTSKQVTHWGTGKDLSYYVETLGIQSNLCAITNGSIVRSEANSVLNRPAFELRVNRTELLKALESTDCNIICKFINIYKKISDKWGGVNHKNVLIIDKYNKMIIRFEPKPKSVIPTLRFTMNKDRVMSELGTQSILTELSEKKTQRQTTIVTEQITELNKELKPAKKIESILKEYTYIDVYGSQPTNPFKLSFTKPYDSTAIYFCVIYSVYAVILFVINYEQLCKNIGNPLVEAAPTKAPRRSSSAEAAPTKARRSSSAGSSQTYISRRPTSLGPKRKKSSKGKGKGNSSNWSNWSNGSNFGGGSRKRIKRKTLKK